MAARNASLSAFASFARARWATIMAMAPNQMPAAETRIASAVGIPTGRL